MGPQGKDGGSKYLASSANTRAMGWVGQWGSTFWALGNGHEDYE